MRGVRLLLPILATLAVGACARQQQTYYVVDPNTGQPVPVVMQQQAAPQQYAQQTYQQPVGPQSEPSERGLFSSRQSAPQIYAQQAYAAQPQYPQSQYAQDQRGLFSSSPAYAQQSYAEPVYQQPMAPPQATSSGERGLFTSSGIGGPFVPAPNGMGRGF